MFEPDALVLGAMILLVAILYSSVGHAGASGYLAAMALFGLAPDTMKPTALVLNILVAAIATMTYARAGHFEWRVFYAFALLSIPAAFIGGLLNLPASVYKPIVGVILLIAAAQLARSARQAALSDSVGRTRAVPLIPAMAVGAGIGLLSGLTGTGGGIFLSPLLLLAGWAGTRLTAGVSAVFILVNSIAGLAGTRVAVAALPDGLPLWIMAAAIGGVIGTQFGSRVFPIATLRYLLAIVLVIAGVKLILT